MESDQRGADMEELQAEKHFRAGDIIMREGEAGQCAWLIQSGRVSVFVSREDGCVLEVGSRGPGSIIGEMAIVDDQPRSATVQAIEDCRLLEVSKEDYARSVRSAHPIVRLVSQLILTRCRDLLSRARGLSDGAFQRLEEQEQAYTAQSNVLDAVRMANEFKVALANGQLRLAYQPLYDLKSGELHGLEALMRWHHPVRGEISPTEFIPMAEDCGLIVEAGRWALREACEALRRLDRATGTDCGLTMSINFSAPDFEDDDFMAHFTRTLKETGTDPARIHMEIVERVLIRPFGGIRGMLEKFRALGVGVAIDDFGTGYSSLSYLHQYPINLLKIDQSFIRNMCEDDMSRRLVRSILILSEEMGMTTIAEGVETAEQAALLREMNCDIVQGYHYARPMSEEAIVALLSERAISAEDP